MHDLPNIANLKQEESQHRNNINITNFAWCKIFKRHI